MITLLTWPPFKDGSWELSREPAWWQLQVFAAAGFALCALPSYFVYQLDSYFHVHESLRYPFAGTLVTIEVLLLCWLVYLIAKKAIASKPAELPEGTPPSKSLERMRGE